MGNIEQLVKRLSNIRHTETFSISATMLLETYSRELRNEVIEECKGVIQEQRDDSRAPFYLMTGLVRAQKLLDQLKQKGSK